MLVLVELAVIMMWGKVKRLRLDPSAYTNFATADELALLLKSRNASFTGRFE